MTSVIAVLPNPKLWSKDEILIVTPFKNYTVHDYPEYFSDSNYLTGTYIQTNMPVILWCYKFVVYCLIASGLRMNIKRQSE